MKLALASDTTLHGLEPELCDVVHLAVHLERRLLCGHGEHKVVHEGPVAEGERTRLQALVVVQLSVLSRARVRIVDEQIALEAGEHSVAGHRRAARVVFEATRATHCIVVHAIGALRETKGANVGFPAVQALRCLDLQCSPGALENIDRICVCSFSVGNKGCRDVVLGQHVAKGEIPNYAAFGVNRYC